MQNEITELRNQVRTLKRIVCLTLVLFTITLPSCRNRQPFYDSINAIQDNSQRGLIAVRTWKGQSFKDALREFGPPSQEFKGSDGVIYYKWYLSKGEFELNFQVKDGIIIEVDSNGSRGAHAAFIRRKHPSISLDGIENVFQNKVDRTGAPWREYPSSK